MRRLAAIVWVIAAGVMTVPALGDGAGVKIHVEAEDRTYFVGEPLVLRVGVENTGAEPVKFSVVRDGARVTNLAMTATDEAGKRVGVINSTLGGSVSEVEIGPGDMVWVRAELFDHVVFIKAGTYRLRVAVNLRDESEDAAKEPSGEVTLKIAMPTETDAAAVLKRIATAGAAGEGGVYRDPPPLGVAHDMGSLGSPVYLPGLLRLVANGDTEAVRGVGSIDTPEATRALVKLLESTSSEVRDAAAWEMMDRLPVSKEEEVLVDAGERALRTRVSKADWREEFREPVRAAALDRATGPDAYPAGAGWLLCTVGKAEDFGVMLQALEEEVRSGKEQGAIADEMVLTAAEVLVRRGAAVPREGSSVAGELVFVRHLRVDGGYRPAGWEARLEKATKADFAGLRKEAAGALGGDGGRIGTGDGRRASGATWRHEGGGAGGGDACGGIAQAIRGA